MLILNLFLVYWIVIASLGVYLSLKIFKKYSKRKQFAVAEEWKGLVRDDYQNWNKVKILLGALVIFPYKVAILVHIIIFSVLMTIHVFFLKIQPKLHPFARPVFNKWQRFILGFVYDIKDDFKDKQIKNAIVVSNHVCWFDVFYLMCGSFPLSFIAKEQVGSMPGIGTVAKAMNSIFIKRKSVEDR